MVKPNSEYDVLIILKVSLQIILGVSIRFVTLPFQECRAILQMEIKSVVKRRNIKKRYTVHVNTLQLYYSLFKTLQLRHKEACEQLEKGRELFTRVLAPLAKLGGGWRHMGLVCCPEVESREQLLQAGLSEEESKVNL